MLALHFEVKFDQHFVSQVQSTVTIDCKLADIKLESSLRLLAEVREKSVGARLSRLLTFFVKMRF